MSRLSALFNIETGTLEARGLRFIIDILERLGPDHPASFEIASYVERNISPQDFEFIVAVQRALALLDWAVQNGVFVDRARLAEVLGARWSVMAQERSVAATDAELHNYILEQFPLTWLQAWISPQKLEAGPT